MTRANQRRKQQIQTVCQYIDTHLDQELSLNTQNDVVSSPLATRSHDVMRDGITGPTLNFFDSDKLTSCK